MSEPILKLDELVGRSKPLKVERLGKTFELIRPEGLTLKQNQQWQAMAKKISLNYGPLAKKNQEKPSYEDTSKAVDDCLRMICPAILQEEKKLSISEKIKMKLHPGIMDERRPFSFNEKLKVLEFYTAEALGKKTDVKGEGKNKNSSKNQIGA